MSSENLQNPLFIEEILTQIFKPLSVNDRKNAKLVCKFWFNVCNQEVFTNEEAFYISLATNFETVTDVLMNSQRTTLNLKFCNSLVDNNSLPLWRACGKRIESLSFHKCTFHKRIIPIIFEICVNLIEFNLRFGEFINNNPKYRDPVEKRKNFYALLSKKKIVRTKLTTFRWKFMQFNFDEFRSRSNELQRFASTFPALKILKLSMVYGILDTIFQDKVALDPPYSATYSMWVKLVATKLKAVERLDLEYIPYDYDYYDDINNLKPRDLSVFRENNLSNLKKISLPLYVLPWTTDENFLTIVSFEFWTYFEIDCVDVNFQTIDLFIATYLILKYQQLEKIYINFQCTDVVRMATFFAALITSNLYSITFDLGHEVVLPEDYAPKVHFLLKNFPRNTSVRHLKIRRNKEPEENYGTDAFYTNIGTTADFLAFCLKYFKNIHYLDAPPGDPEVVFHYQTNLKHLKMKLMYQPSGDVVNIESLQVLDVRDTVLNILSCYHFPNLKFLLIHEFHEDTVCLCREEYKQIEHTQKFIERFSSIEQLIIKNAPNVEVLQVDGNSLLKIEAFTKFFKSCRNFVKLRHVSMCIESEVIIALETDVAAEMMRYMPQCPSLRTVRLETWIWTANLVFNVVNKTFELFENRSKNSRLGVFSGTDYKNFFFPKR